LKICGIQEYTNTLPLKFKVKIQLHKIVFIQFTLTYVQSRFSKIPPLQRTSPLGCEQRTLLVALRRYSPKLQRLTFWLPERRQSATEKPETHFLHRHSVEEIKLFEGRAVHSVCLQELKHASSTIATENITHVQRNFTGRKRPQNHLLQPCP